MPNLSELLQSKRSLRHQPGEPPEPRIAEKLICSDEDAYHRLMKETYFEEYYAAIEQFTFRSKVLPLDLEEITAIHNAYRRYQESKDVESCVSSFELVPLVKRVDECIRDMGGDRNHFVRLSSRSPKDSIFEMEKFKEIYREELEGSNGRSLSAKLMAFYKASTKALSIRSGLEALELLITSDRVNGDLEVCIEKGETLKLVVREFVEFPVENELRAFVYEGSFTALTQYNNIVYFPELAARKMEIESKVRSFLEKFVIPSLKTTISSFVLDLVVDNSGRVYVIEVNPFGELAGACLFSWVKDRPILMGQKPFEFRLVESEPSFTYIKAELSEKVIAFFEAYES